jgi:hypothetical protein
MDYIKTEADVEHSIGGSTDLMDLDNMPEPSPIETVEHLIAVNEAELARLNESVKHTRELLKRLRATLKAMQDGPGA